MVEQFRAWDDYFIPGTTVLKNKVGASDATTLRQREEFAAHVRMVELAGQPIAGLFDYGHMKAIHGYIFQDVYEWAGQERVGPPTRMSKDGPNVVDFEPGDPAAPTVSYAYYAGSGVANAAAEQYRKLAQENFLRGLPQEAFVERLAEYWGELNVIHSFREGNTRTQFVFFSQLAEQAGFRLDASQFALGQSLRDEFVLARFHNQASGKTIRLANVLGRAIEPIPVLTADAAATRAAALARGDFPFPAAGAVQAIYPHGERIIARVRGNTGRNISPRGSADR